MPSRSSQHALANARGHAALRPLFLLLAVASPAAAQFETIRPRVVDPPNPLEGYQSLAEFNTAGDLEGWTPDAQITDSEVTAGVWRGVSGTDPKLSRGDLNIPTAGGDNVLEFRLKRSDFDNSNIQVFWADDAGPFAEPERVITILPEFVPHDEEFHTYRLYLGSHVTGTLKGLRIDATDNEGVELIFDYIRYGGKTVITDPPPAALVNAYVSLAEFNTKADLQGWTVSAQVNNAHVADGSLKALSFGDDAQILSGPGLNVDTTAPSRGILELRLKRSAADSSPLEIFYDHGEADFSAPRRLFIDGSQIPADGAFHVYQLNVADAWEGSLSQLRIDPTAFARNKGFELDYVRLGAVSPDNDGDQVPDVHETNTGVYLNAQNTGTDPAKPDTDGDGFNDGTEVAKGTNPVSAASRPAAEAGAYTNPAAVYAINTPVSPNAPVAVTGTVTGYTVAPPLPAGLILDSATGVITGTPVSLSAAAAHTVSATFANGQTAATQLTIEVRNPFVSRYSPVTASLTRGINVELTPESAGSPPVSFTVSPPLPAGLTLDPVTGVISGAPAAASPASSHTVTSRHTGYPDSDITLNLQVVDSLALHYTFDSDGSAQAGPAANFGPAGSVSHQIAAVGGGSLRLAPRVFGAEDTHGQDGAWSSAPLTWATDTRTIAFWVKVGQQSDGAATIIASGVVGAGTRFDVRLEGLSTLIRTEVGGGNFGVAPQDLGSGDWYHVTVTVAPATALFGDVAYYIHDSAARLLDSGYFNSTRTLALNTSPSPLYLGDSYVVDAEGTSQRDFVGYLDDVRVYNTALSPWEARALAKLWSPAVAAPLAFQITNLVSDSAAGTATVTWNSKEDRTYELQWSETLEAGAWTTLPYTIYADAGATTTYIDYSGAAENGRRFYRVIEK